MRVQLCIKTAIIILSKRRAIRAHPVHQRWIRMGYVFGLRSNNLRASECASSSSAALSPSVTAVRPLPPAPPCILESASFRRRKFFGKIFDYVRWNAFMLYSYRVRRRSPSHREIIYKYIIYICFMYLYPHVETCVPHASAMGLRPMRLRRIRPFARAYVLGRVRDERAARPYTACAHTARAALRNAKIHAVVSLSVVSFCGARAFTDM